MFNFIKKSKQNMKLSTGRNDELSKYQQIIEHILNGQNADNLETTTSTNKMTGIRQHGDAVTIDLNLDERVDPEEIQRQIGIQLQQFGIKEVNLNISLLPNSNSASSAQVSNPASKSSGVGKGSEKTLPKTTNAAVKKEDVGNAGAANSEPAITKQAPTQSSLKPHPRIQHILVVASGKGGVGKSTTTVNIALALQKLGKKVGVLDADIYGPSIPSMLGVEGVKPQLENEQFVPIEAHGLAMLSIGSLLDSNNTPVAWRGPKATGALMQLFNQTNWPMLDYLIIDMPPGTGDIQLTLAQRIPVTGAVIVTTPQHIALMDAQKGIEMFNKTNIAVVGVVENMALHTCSNCGHTEAIFGSGGGEQVAKEYQVPLLGKLPLASDIRSQADSGEPSVIANNGMGDDYAHFYLSIAENIESNIGKYTKQRDDGRIF